MKKSLTISKLDAAKRQLDTFIKLYFHSGDPVAMHTLVTAAFCIIRDLNTKRGGDPTSQDKIFEYVNPKHHKLLRSKINEAQNFFKHANRDHTAVLEFNPDDTEFIAVDACLKYVELTGEYPPLFQIFNGWMKLTHPEMFTLPESQRKTLEDEAETFLLAGKLAYFNGMLPIAMRSGL